MESPNGVKTAAPMARRPPVRELVLIGQDQALVRRTEAGVIKALQVKIALSEARKEVYSMSSRAQVDGQWRSVRTWSISAAGYDRLNGVAGINVVTPTTVVVDGVEQPNPYIGRDDAGNVITVFVRKVGLGRSKIGNLVAIDQTLYFNPRAYLVSMLHKRKLLDAGIVKIVTALAYRLRPAKDRLGLWFIPTMEGLGLQVDITHKEFLDVHKSYGELVQFADRRASSICTRNVLKHHPGMAAAIVHVDKGQAVVDVLGWPATDQEFRKLNEAADALARGEQAPEGVELVAGGAIEAKPEEDREGFGEAGEAADAGEMIDVTEEGRTIGAEEKSDACPDCPDGAGRVKFNPGAGLTVWIPCPSCQEAELHAKGMELAQKQYDAGARDKGGNGPAQGDDAPSDLFDGSE